MPQNQVRKADSSQPVRRENVSGSAGRGEVLRNVWERYRSKQPINISDMVEDRTMDAVLASPSISSPSPKPKNTFDPTEMTGRSTGRLATTGSMHATAAAEMSTDMILSDSFVHRIRKMSTKNDGDDSYGKGLRESLPVNFKSAENIPLLELRQNRTVLDPPQMDGWSINSDEFAPHDQAMDKLKHDEIEWQNEYGILPADFDRSGRSITSSGSRFTNSESRHRYTESKSGGVWLNLTEFSGYLPDNNMADSADRHFANRCGDVHEMLKARSPTKRKPIALLSDSQRTGTDYSSTSGDSKKYSQASSSFYTEDELRIVSGPRPTNATYDKKSILSVSSIARRLDDDSKESPATFVSNYSNALRAMAAKNGTVSSISSNAGRSIDVQSTASAFTTANTSLGMLAQMNSTRIDDDKENKSGPNSSAETESASEFSDYVGDISSAANGYESSFNGQRRELEKPSSNKRVDLAESRPAANMKRMRSPQPTTSETTTHLRVPDPFIKRSDKTPLASAPVRTSPKKTNAAESHVEAPNVVEREFAAVLHRSPMGSPKYSLPNYGLRNQTRGLSQSPSAYPIRSNSQLSTNSEFSQNDGRFPLKANKSQMTWECVKLQKSVSKSFVVKNIAEKRLTVKLYVTGPGFQIATGLQDQGPLVLQGNECRTISVIFCPTVIGKAIGKVTFKPSKGWPDETERSISLYGYGGHTTLQLQGIERGPVGISFLKMGETSSIRSTTLQRFFVIYNKGPLNGMATITVKPKTNQYIHETHIQIEPSKCVIKPDTSVQVCVTYKLRRKDLEKLSQKSCDVLTVATLEVIIGADANRQRIAQILTRPPTFPPTYRSLEFLIKDFPQDDSEDFSNFNEGVDNIADLFNCFKTSDIALTINRTTLDETRDTCTDLSGIEESVFFRTLIDERVGSDLQPHRMQHEVNGYQQGAIEETWSVYPTRLVMDQMENCRKRLTIRNDFNKPQTFQLETNYRHLLAFSSESGLVNPGNECKIEVEMKTNIYVPADLKITVFIESDSIEVPVTVRPPPAFMKFK